jgi:hypothetical protein
VDCILLSMKQNRVCLGLESFSRCRAQHKQQSKQEICILMDDLTRINSLLNKALFKAAMNQVLLRRKWH